MKDKDYFQELTEVKVADFLTRFENFYDSLLRKSQIFFMNSGVKTKASVVLAVKDYQETNNIKWVDMTLEIEDVSFFRLLEGNKTTCVVLSYGLDIKFLGEDIYLDFSPYRDNILTSDFVIVGKQVKWHVSAYNSTIS